MERQSWNAAHFIVGIPLGLVMLAMLASYPLNVATCEAVAVKMGLPHYYSIHTGCMYQINGGWIEVQRLVVTVGADGRTGFSTPLPIEIRK